MKIGTRKNHLVIRRSMFPRQEPRGFHDIKTYEDGTWMIAFFSILIYTMKKP